MASQEKKKQKSQLELREREQVFTSSHSDIDPLFLMWMHEQDKIAKNTEELIHHERTKTKWGKKVERMPEKDVIEEKWD